MAQDRSSRKATGERSRVEQGARKVHKGRRYVVCLGIRLSSRTGAERWTATISNALAIQRHSHNKSCIISETYQQSYCPYSTSTRLICPISTYVAAVADPCPSDRQAKPHYPPLTKRPKTPCACSAGQNHWGPWRRMRLHPSETDEQLLVAKWISCDTCVPCKGS